jgi:hypothetical protein
MSEKPKVRATITFLGEPRQIPQPGDKVVLRVADGSWQGGFRCLSEPPEESGERAVWIAREVEYQAPRREVREPAGDRWPLSQMAKADHQSDR